MSRPDLDLENLRGDWQQPSGEMPQLTIARIRARLWRRWLWVGLEVLALIAVLALMVYAATIFETLAEWIYWGFFAALLCLLGPWTVMLRWRSLFRRDDSAAEIIDHAWRDAHARDVGGRIGGWVSLVVMVFVLAWFAVRGLLEGTGIGGMLAEHATVLALLVLWCVGGMLLGAWQHEKGRRQKLELTRLREMLAAD